jgi:hypothetical protein
MTRSSAKRRLAPAGRGTGSTQKSQKGGPEGPPFLLSSCEMTKAFLTPAWAASKMLLSRTNGCGGGHTMGDKAPYLVSLILGVLGWLVSHMVDRIIEAPTLEYHIQKETAADRSMLSVELHNITREKSFEGLKATIYFPNATSIYSPHLTAAEPAFNGKAPPTVSGSTATFTLPKMMPGAQLNFSAVARAKAPPSCAFGRTVNLLSACKKEGSKQYLRGMSLGYLVS